MTKSGNESLDNNEQKGNENKKRRNGRNGFENYPNATVNHMTNADLKKGDKCPCCHKGKLYPGEERKLLQFSGNAPVVAEKFIKETLRCNGCSTEFVAKGNIVKWTNSARSSIALQKCMGIPFYRLSKLQGLYKVPISEANLWQQVAGLWKDGGGLEIFSELLNAASSCKNFYVDDTRAKILEVIVRNKRLGQEMAFEGTEDSDKSDRDKKSSKPKGCYSTILCTETSTSHEIILYFTKQNYCGENIALVVNDGNKKLMSDASTMNIPNIEEVILETMTLFKCIRHGYAKFEELLAYHPEECRYFVEEIKSIYQIDRANRNMSDQKRLKHHQKHSAGHIDNIYRKIDELFAYKLVEPNSHLGKAMKYWLNHKEGLTQFLRVGGMELDNNRSERGLKRIILQRKNSLFFKTLSSAEVLSGISSIVVTCMANDIDSFGYLNWMQDNATILKKQPKNYLPWKYVEYLNSTERVAA